MAKILGVDFGLKQIGLAISDENCLLAFPREVIVYDKPEEGVGAIRDYAKKEKVGKIVVGLPKNMNGSESEQTGKTREFAEKLEKAGFEIVMEDERLTTMIAEKNNKKGERADALAAQLILQTFLDRKW